MLTSFSLMILFGLLADTLFKKIKLPGLLGMLLLGVALGPYGLNWLTQDLLRISEDLRKLALIIILLRAGLGISKQDLKKAGVTALKLSFLPGLIEGFIIAFFATLFLGFSFIEGSILGFIIAAVSPAVVVPMMLKLSEKNIGTNQGVPTLILAGASIDDVFAITLFTAFIGLYFGTNKNILLQILGIPLSIALGIGLGVLFGLVLSFLLNRYTIRIPKILLAVIGAAILLTAIESWLQNLVNIASLLGVMTLGYVLLQKIPDISQQLSEQLKHIWVLAEIVLFVLVGAEVNPTVAINAGLTGLLIIAFGLTGRSLGVFAATLGSHLKWRERLFCIIAYTPKATVQAAIGAIPLSLGIDSGEIILAIAVLSIIITAPLGSIGISKSAQILLSPIK